MGRNERGHEEYMIALMYDGLELGKFINSNGKSELVLNDNIDKNWLPFIFSLGIDKHTDMNIIINHWKKDRVFPKNRFNKFWMLLKEGMLIYNVDKIAEKTRCSLLTDPYWLVYRDEDTFYNCTARGKLNSKYYPYNSMQLENEDKYIWRI